MTSSLALLFQEALAAIARIRRGEGVLNANQFRSLMLANVRAAEQKGREQGYRGKDVKLAIFAVVAMADETVLKLNDNAFAEWSGNPLSLQIFKTNNGGIEFFSYANELLERDSDTPTVDLLEVYLLCLLLGFSGRHKDSAAPEIQQLKRKIRSKIDRTRRHAYVLPELWKLPDDRPGRAADPWFTRLAWCALLGALLAVFAFGLAKWQLQKSVAELEASVGYSASQAGSGVER